MSDEIEVGIIGLGKMGIAHMGILNALDGVRVRAVCEKQKLVTNSVESVLPSISIYDDFKKMLDNESLDTVFITSPTSLHIQNAESCLDRGICFFVEKPLGVSAGESKDFIGKVRNEQLVNMVGYCKHFIETFKKAKEVLDSGELGKPIYLTSFTYVSQLFGRGVGWRYKKESSGGGVLNILATHLVDLLLWLFGDIVSVEGHTRAYYSGEVEDFAHSYLKFRSGLEGFLDTSWSIRNYRLPEIKIEVQCENGMLSVTEDCLRYSLDRDAKPNVFYRQDLFKGVPIHLGGPEYTREDAYFIERVRRGERTELDVYYAYKVQCVTDVIYESASRGKELEIDYGEGVND